MTLRNLRIDPNVETRINQLLESRRCICETLLDIPRPDVLVFLRDA